jgi:polysaccharide export outer membrane protein
MGLVLGGCAIGVGCHTSPLTSVCAPQAPVVRMAGPEYPGDARPDPKTYLVKPGMVMLWCISSPKNPKDPGIESQEAVRPDGMLDLGPYGFVHVGGLSVQSAANAIKAHVARQVPGAAVHVRVRPVARVPAARRPVQGEGVAAERASEPGQGPDLALTSGQGVPGAGPGVAPARLQVGQPNLDLPATGAEVPGAEPPLAGSLAADKKSDKTGDDKSSDKDKASDKDAGGATESQAAAASLIPPNGFAHLPGPHGAPNELAKVSLPPYRIEPPDILEVDYEVDPAAIAEGSVLRTQAIHGPRLVRPDGTILLGIYGTVHVAGLSLEEARVAIAAKIRERYTKLAIENLVVDVIAYNSKFYYVITDGAGYGEGIFRFPITGSETVLDALSQVQGLPPQATKKHIWVARRTPNGGPAHILTVDYIGVTQGGLAGTNYQIMPGDRVYVNSDPVRKFDTEVAKYLSPVERIFGTVLLGSETVNSIRNRGSGTGTGTGR